MVSMERIKSEFEGWLLYEIIEARHLGKNFKAVIDPLAERFLLKHGSFKYYEVYRIGYDLALSRYGMDIFDEYRLDQFLKKIKNKTIEELLEGERK